MPGDCSNSWQPYGCDWGIGYLLHWTYLLERLVLLVLALMLARVALIAIRGSYLLIYRARSADASSSARSRLAAELCVKQGILRSVFSTAPYLGLMGTCFGILDGLSRGYSGRPQGFVVRVAYVIDSALLSTAAGILVAVAATCLHKYLCTRVDLLKRDLYGGPLETRRYALKPRLSILPYAVIAAPLMAMFIAVFMTFPSFHPPVGLPVRLMPVGALEPETSPPEPIVITVVGTNPTALPVLYVNAKKTAWDELKNKLRTEVGNRPLQPIYVQADKGLYWNYVTDVIDVAEGLDAKAVLLTATPDPRLTGARQPPRSRK